MVSGGYYFGLYVDNVIWGDWLIGLWIWIDLLVMLFFVEFDEYDGGEFVIEDIYGLYEVKLLVGDCVFYFLISFYFVMLVMWGVWVVFFFWF